jgi:hypothetical protein
MVEFLKIIAEIFATNILPSDISDVENKTER